MGTQDILGRTKVVLLAVRYIRGPVTRIGGMTRMCPYASMDHQRLAEAVVGGETKVPKRFASAK